MRPHKLLEPIMHAESPSESVKISADEFESFLNIQQSVLDLISKDCKDSDILNQLCELSENLLDNSVASIVLFDKKTDSFKLASAPSIAPEHHEYIKDTVYYMYEEPITKGTLYNKPSCAINTFCDLSWTKNAAILKDNFNIFSYWSMPVLSNQGNIIGIFSLSSFECRTPNNFHNRLLKICASTIKILLERKELRKLSSTDKLTRLWNRVKLDEVLTAQENKMDKPKHSFAVLLIDIDLFKQVNDSFGHNVGDTVLIEISDILRQEVASDDVVGRWGGEEFMVILSEPNSSKAPAIAQKIRQAVATHKFSTVGKITVSIGACIVSNNTRTLEVINNADKALYQAKRLGRNCVSVHYKDRLFARVSNDVQQDSISA